MSLEGFTNYENIDWKWWSILPRSTNPWTIRLTHLFSNPILWKTITSFVCSSTQPWRLEEFYRRFFHLVCLNLPLISKYLRLYVSTSYFKTDIVLFDAFDYCRLIVKSISEILPTSLALALCIVHHQPGDFQYKGPVTIWYQTVIIFNRVMCLKRFPNYENIDWSAHP